MKRRLVIASTIIVVVLLFVSSSPGCGSAATTTLAVSTTATTATTTTQAPTTTEAVTTTGAPTTEAVTTTEGAALPEIIPGVRTVLYEDTQLGISLHRPEDTTIEKTGFEQFLPLTQAAAVAFVLPKALFKGTNLLEAGVYVGQKATADVPAPWADPYEGETAAGTTSINGISWATFTSSEGAAGNIYDERVYRTAHNGTCYEIAELLHSAEIGNYDPGTVTEFDKTQFEGYLEAIARSFTFE